MLNENIKTIRKSEGLSQQELAVKVSVVRQIVSKWEQGPICSSPCALGSWPWRRSGYREQPLLGLGL